MNPFHTSFRYPYLLVGIDYEGENREAGYDSLDRAIIAGEQMLKSDSFGPAWQGYAVWGNYPKTLEWMILAKGGAE